MVGYCPYGELELQSIHVYINTLIVNPMVIYRIPGTYCESGAPDRCPWSP